MFHNKVNAYLKIELIHQKKWVCNFVIKFYILID